MAAIAMQGCSPGLQSARWGLELGRCAWGGRGEEVMCEALEFPGRHLVLWRISYRLEGLVGLGGGIGVFGRRGFC